MSDDPELETFLRRFRPTPPAPLARPRRPSWWWAIAAAAGLVALAWWGRSSHPARPPRTETVSSRPRPATLGAFRASLHTGTYEAALDDLDAVLLPDPTRPGGALRSLADVNRDR